MDSSETERRREESMYVWFYVSLYVCSLFVLLLFMIVFFFFCGLSFSTVLKDSDIFKYQDLPMSFTPFLPCSTILFLVDQVLIFWRRKHWRVMLQDWRRWFGEGWNFMVSKQPLRRSRTLNTPGGGGTVSCPCVARVVSSGVWVVSRTVCRRTLSTHDSCAVLFFSVLSSSLFLTCFFLCPENRV